MTMQAIRLLAAFAMLVTAAGAERIRVAVGDLSPDDSPQEARSLTTDALIGEFARQSNLETIAPETVKKTIVANKLTLAMVSPAEISKIVGAQKVVIFSISADKRISALSYKVYDAAERRTFSSGTDSCSNEREDIARTAKIIAWKLLPYLDPTVSPEGADLVKDSINTVFYATQRAAREKTLFQKKERARINRRYGLITGTSAAVAAGLLLFGKVYDSKASDKFNEASTLYDEYRSAVSDFDAKWDAATSADEEAKDLVKARNVLYFSAAAVGTVSLATFGLWQVKQNRAGARLARNGNGVELYCTIGRW